MSSHSQLPLAVTLATRSLLPFGARFVADVAAKAGGPRLDLDLSPSFPGSRRTLRRMPEATLPPAALWLPDDLATLEPAALAVHPCLARWLPGCPLLAVDASRHNQPLAESIGAATRLARFFDQAGVRVVVALRSRHLWGGRRHLAHLTMLRRLTEEWDLGLAIDLAGPFDPQWEAEAAVLRLGPRLELLRLRSLATDAGAVDRDRVARRALRAAIEQRRDVLVAVDPIVPWWRRYDAPALAATWANAADRLRPGRGGPSLYPSRPPLVEEPGQRRSTPST